MGTFQYKGQGLRSVGAYQVSGAPFITGSTGLGQNKCHMVEFPFVTKSVTITNTTSNAGYNIRLHFNSGSTAITIPGDKGEQNINDEDDIIAKKHFVTVPAGFGSVTMDVKCKRLYISQNANNSDFSYEVFAELTGIPTSSMYHLTGSGITE